MGNKTLIGWKEWVALPDLKIPGIKAKIDTGARTSALHAYELEAFKKNNKDIVRFLIHPLQNRSDIYINCETEIIDKRIVKDSGGHAEERFFIQTPLLISDKKWDIEISLTCRENMLFRMLVGRTALVKGAYYVDPDLSYVMGKINPELYNNETIENQL